MIKGVFQANEIVHIKSPWQEKKKKTQQGVFDGHERVGGAEWLKQSGGGGGKNKMRF